MKQSGLGRIVQKAPCRPLPLLLGALWPTGREGVALMADVSFRHTERAHSSNSVLGQCSLSRVSEGTWLSLAKTRCLLTAQNTSWLHHPNLQEMKLTV